jgi:hypothetical protein
MKKLIIIGMISLYAYKGFSGSLQIIINPDNGSVEDYFQMVVYVFNDQNQLDTTYSGPVYFCVDGEWNHHLMDPTTGSAYKGSLQMNVRIYRAGNVKVHGTCPRGSGISNPLNLSPSSPKRIVILYENQILVRGDTTIGGKDPFTPSPVTAGDSVNFRIILTDKYYNPVSGNLNFYLSSNDSLVKIDTLNLSDSTKTKIRFKIATNPPQFFQSSDSRVVYALPLETNYIGDTLSPPFQVYAGNYKKLLLLAPGERHFPGDENKGKKGEISPLPSAIPFYLKLYACDDFFNFRKGVNDTGILVFNPSNQYIDTVPSFINLVNGVDSFKVTIFKSGPYYVYGLDKNIQRQSEAVILQILGCRYITKVSPDTVLSGKPIHLIVTFVDYQGNKVPSTHTLYLSAVRASDLQPAQGVFYPNAVQMELGEFEGDVFYTTENSEEIKIKIVDSLGTGEHYTDKIFVAYLKGIPDTLINYPNPFGKVGSEETNFVFLLPKSADVKLYIYDLFGNLIKKFEVNGVAGLNIIKWDGRNDKGKKVASGTYVAVLRATSGAENVLTTKRLIGIIR